MKKWLFNPFEMLAGWTALIAGTIVIFITAVVAYYARVHLDGVIDVHETETVSFSTCLLEGLIDWLSITLFAYLAGLLFSKSSIRLLDVLGTQALARFPFLLSCLVSLLCFNEKMLRYLEYTLLKKGEAVEVSNWELGRFGCMMLLDIILLVWAVMLMYKAYSVSCNVKGNSAVLSFVGLIVLAEVLAKLLIFFYN